MRGPRGRQTATRGGIPQAEAARAPRVAMSLPLAYLLAWTFPALILAALLLHRYRTRRKPWTEAERRTWARLGRKARRRKVQNTRESL